MTINDRYPSLRTADPASGLALSLELAQELSDRLRASHASVPKPGGMNFAEPAPIPVEMIAGILLVAVSIANDGWSKKEGAVTGR